MFHGRESDASCCGNQDANQKVVVTYEVLNLTLTQTIIDELKGSTNDYTNGAGLDVNSSMYSSGTGYDLLTRNGGVSVGDEVNIYVVYLSDNVNRRTDFGVTLRMILLLLDTIETYTLVYWFRFSLHTGNNKNNGDIQGMVGQVVLLN